MKTVAFVPIKLNNERLPGKNLKVFDNGEPLLTYILKTALSVRNIDEIYVYCSSESVKPYIPTGVKFLKRPQSLDSSDVSITEIISMFTREINADIYAMLHATAPFISGSSIERGIKAIQNGAYDSALAVERRNSFLWIGGKPVNYDITNIPRTQDLEPFYTETSGLYLFNSDVARQSRRIGDSPYLVEVSPIEAIDIDEPIDFEIANAVFNFVIKPKGASKTLPLSIMM